MIPELKNEWVTALRSGDYTQGQLYLQKDYRFCCLGVLCDIDPNVQLIPNPTYKDSFVPDAVFSDTERSNATLARSYIEKIGLDLEVVKDLISMNDRGKTFYQIAEHIEANA